MTEEINHNAAERYCRAIVDMRANDKSRITLAYFQTLDAVAPQVMNLARAYLDLCDQKMERV